MPCAPMQILQNLRVWRCRHEVLPLGAILLPVARRDGHEAVRRVLPDRRVCVFVVRAQLSGVHLKASVRLISREFIWQVTSMVTLTRPAPYAAMLGRHVIACC